MQLPQTSSEEWCNLLLTRRTWLACHDELHPGPDEGCPTAIRAVFCWEPRQQSNANEGPLGEARCNRGPRSFSC